MRLLLLSLSRRAIFFLPQADQASSRPRLRSSPPPAASYDIEKEGEVVAVLTLVKSAYRLGETVSGVVTFNQPSCTRRVLKVRAPYLSLARCQLR